MRGGGGGRRRGWAAPQTGDGQAAGEQDTQEALAAPGRSSSKAQPACAPAAAHYIAVLLGGATQRRRIGLVNVYRMAHLGGNLRVKAGRGTGQQALPAHTAVALRIASVPYARHAALACTHLPVDVDGGAKAHSKVNGVCSGGGGGGPRKGPIAANPRQKNKPKMHPVAALMLLHDALVREHAARTASAATAAAPHPRAERRRRPPPPARPPPHSCRGRHARSVPGRGTCCPPAP
jgi:hypothetical protein